MEERRSMSKWLKDGRKSGIELETTKAQEEEDEDKAVRQSLIQRFDDNASKRVKLNCSQELASFNWQASKVFVLFCSVLVCFVLVCRPIKLQVSRGMSLSLIGSIGSGSLIVGSKGLMCSALLLSSECLPQVPECKCLWIGNKFVAECRRANLKSIPQVSQ